MEDSVAVTTREAEDPVVAPVRSREVQDSVDSAAVATKEEEEDPVAGRPREVQDLEAATTKEVEAEVQVVARTKAEVEDSIPVVTRAAKDPAPVRTGEVMESLAVAIKAVVDPAAAAPTREEEREDSAADSITKDPRRLTPVTSASTRTRCLRCTRV